MKKNTRGIIVYSIILGLFLIGMVTYQYLKSGRLATIQIELPAGTSLFIDDKALGTNPAENASYFETTVPIGTHTILVARDDYWPWKKDIEVKVGDVERLNPFLARQSSMGFIIGEADPEYDALRVAINSIKVPTKTDKLVSSSRKVALWAEETILFAEWIGDIASIPEYFCLEGGCTSALEVYRSNVPISNITFYPEREDVAVISTGEKIIAIELNKKGTQNFQPIFSGTAPQFVISSQNTILVLDNNQLLELAP